MGRRALAMAAAAIIFSASPIKNGTIPTMSVFARVMPVTIFNQVIPQA
jgi:hypothetical protein